MKTLLLVGALFYPSLVPTDTTTLRSRQVLLRSIQVVKDGKPLLPSAYQLTTSVSATSVRSKELPLAVGPTAVSPDTYWTVRYGTGEYILWQVEQYLAQAHRYDVRLELRSSAHPLACVDLSYSDNKGNELESHTTIVSISGEKVERPPTCDRLFLIPAQERSHR